VTDVFANFDERAQEQEQAAKKWTLAHQRICECAYEALHRNKYGKELRKRLEDVLKCPAGEEGNFAYVAGQQDMIRTLLGYAEEYKRKSRGDNE